MPGQLELTDEEWALIGELLDRERSELPNEIHHTRSRGLRQGLMKRRAMVEDLLARIPKMEVA
ncbi:MAG: hypothetical protein PHO07_14525 [Pirellulales bacterium]|jgi:hypothetical protein|nr:hypothetical protein [Thermoguttaceae bacterium]MDD4788388.1 hypothetical protein [Pirellulales bacterium]MDI9444403.1 hypothetical protein [Planctomycetota bacterium]NLZ01596.1 hypothetical protein [Pirellulaceae bacterium]